MQPGLSNKENLYGARVLLLALWGGACAAIVAAPVMAAFSYSRIASLIYEIFSPVCHQMPDRSYVFFGEPLAVCHRCFGVYSGLLLGSLIPKGVLQKLASAEWRRRWVLACCAPILFDGVFSLLGVWEGVPVFRSSTGFLFGAMLATLLIPGISQFIVELPQMRFFSRGLETQGGNK
jgi:uncharacterized membrane protein